MNEHVHHLGDPVGRILENPWMFVLGFVVVGIIALVIRAGDRGK